MSLPSKAARRSVEQIRSAAIQAMRDHDLGERETLFEDDDVACDITHLVESDTCTVKIWSLGPKPKGKTGRKRDLQNLQEGILDSLQKLVYDDDRQVCSLTMRRLAGKQPRWIKCDHCEDFWCRRCDDHAYECKCESIERLEFDPYTESGP